MPSLDSRLRNALEKAVVRGAREGRRCGARRPRRSGSQRLKGVCNSPGEQRALRNILRAKARQLGSGSQSDGFTLLVEEVAYVQWHRMLFARFLPRTTS